MTPKQSDYISLEDLKKLDDEALFDHWKRAKFPFEYAMCGCCLTQHTRIAGGWKCLQREHLDFIRAIGLPDLSAQHMRPHLEHLYALRLFYKHLYPNNPPEIMETEVACSENEAVRK